jgi:hypothetical protein
MNDTDTIKNNIGTELPPNANRVNLNGWLYFLPPICMCDIGSCPVCNTTNNAYKKKSFEYLTGQIFLDTRQKI